MILDWIRYWLIVWGLIEPRLLQNKNGFFLPPGYYKKEDFDKMSFIHYLSKIKKKE